MVKFIREIYKLRPWYHDFEKLGIQTKFPPERKWKFFGSTVKGIRDSVKQQARKESVINEYMRRSLNALGDNVSPLILDLFCSDGYYGFLAKQMCQSAKILGVDINKQDIYRAKIMAKYLKYSDMDFIVNNAIEYPKNNCNIFDIVINTGGLYHISDPYGLLKSLKNVVGSYLVLQSAITVEHNDPEYFVTPRPGWTWGSWFTHARLESWLSELEYCIVDCCVNEREGENPEKIGASYFLLTLKDNS